MRRALAAGALVLLAAGARPPSDQAMIGGTAVDLARRAAVVATGALDASGALAVDRFWKGSGPSRIALGPGALAGQPPGRRVAAFLEPVPGRPGALRPLPLGADAGPALLALDGDRLVESGATMAEIMATADPPRDWRDRLRGSVEDPAARQ